MGNKPYLMFEATSEVSGKSWYKFRVVPVGDLPATLWKLLGPSAPDELMALDVPLLIPSSISQGETFSIYGGSGTWQAPEDMVFVFLKGQGHVVGVYPTNPGPEDVILSQTLLDRPEAWYCENDEINEYPPGDSPEGKEVRSNGWVFPDDLEEEWGYIEKAGWALRMLSPWYITEVWFHSLFLWGGCNIQEAAHFLNNPPNPALPPGNNRWRWPEPKLIFTCHEEDPNWLYWVERETLGNIESLSVWMYESTPPLYFYPWQVELPKIDSTLMPVLAALSLLPIDIELPGGNLREFLRAHLAAGYKYMPLGSAANLPLGSAVSLPLGMRF